MMFAPSTIAISAIILSFSTFRIDCKDWLDCVPNKCFRNISLDKDSLLLDIDKCLDTFQRIEKINNTLPKSTTASPTSIAAAPPSPCTLINEENCTKLMNPKSHINSTISTNNFLDRGRGIDNYFKLDNLDIEAIENDSSLNSPAVFYK